MVYLARQALIKPYLDPTIYNRMIPEINQPTLSSRAPLGALKMLPFLRAGDFDGVSSAKLAHAQRPVENARRCAAAAPAFESTSRSTSTRLSATSKTFSVSATRRGSGCRRREARCGGRGRAAREQERNTGLEFALARLTEEIEHREVHLPRERGARRARR